MQQPDIKTQVGESLNFDSTTEALKIFSSQTLPGEVSTTDRIGRERAARWNAQYVAANAQYVAVSSQMAARTSFGMEGRWSDDGWR